MEWSGTNRAKFYVMLILYFRIINTNTNFIISKDFNLESMLIGPDLLRINQCHRPRLTDPQDRYLLLCRKKASGSFLQLQEAHVSDRSRREFVSRVVRSTVH